MKYSAIKIALASSVFLIAAAGPTTVAADMTRIEGTIKTDEGVAVSGYPVVIYNDDTQHVAVTDAQGVFVADNLPNGEYTILPANRPNEPVAFEVANPTTQRGLKFLRRNDEPFMVQLGTITVPTR